MIVAAVLNGWGASSRRRESRTAALVRDVLGDRDHIIMARRAMFLLPRYRRFRRYIRAHQGHDNALLCVSKSLGSLYMVIHILNQLRPLVYRRIAFLSIDLNYPTWEDWRPNLNHIVVPLRHRVDSAVNIYVVGRPRQQAGARLAGANVTNIAVEGYDHISIVQAAVVRESLEMLVDFLG